MSGILASWQSRSLNSWRAMLTDLTVLGQDGQGDWHDPQLGLSLGRTQFYNTPESCLEPPVLETPAAVLVWDGRLDARESLLAGRGSVTDAQLLIEAYERWGLDCLQHLIGSFAFVLWDKSRQRLVAGCDPTGQCRLAYAWDGHTLLLASRALALLRHPQVSAQLDDLYLAHTICNLWAHPPGSTAFAQIKRILPGQALVLQADQLQWHQVSQLQAPDGSKTGLKSAKTSASTSETYSETFWDLLNQAVKDRLRNFRPVCTTLSGGLDSTTVTVGLLNHKAEIDACSIVTDCYPEFDEYLPIQAFLERYPQVRWQPVNCDTAWSLTESWDHLPLPDDPLISCTLPMHLKLMHQIQQAGFGVVFDGEWGDELFRCSLQDLYQSGQFNQVLGSLKTNPRWYSSLWWELLLPRMPTPIQALWFARYQHRSSPFPPWVKLAYQQQAPVQEAWQQHLQHLLLSSQADVIGAFVRTAAYVGSSEVYRPIKANYQLEFVSPFQDRRLIEFALSIPPALQSHPLRTKPFLRAVNQATLPDAVRLRPKLNYFDPLKYAGIGRTEQALQALERVKQCAYLEPIVEVSVVEKLFWQYRQSYGSDYQPGQPFHNTLAEQLYNLFAFCNWHDRLQQFCSPG
jgi:asparagine synthase (glutamine-hydrolysing)